MLPAQVKTYNSIRQSFAPASNFLKCFIRQISSDFSTVKVLRYTVTLIKAYIRITFTTPSYGLCIIIKCVTFENLICGYKNISQKASDLAIMQICVIYLLVVFVTFHSDFA